MTNTRLVYNRDGSVVCEQCKTVHQPSSEIVPPSYNSQSRVVNTVSTSDSTIIHQQQPQQNAQYSTQNRDDTSGTVVDSKLLIH